MSGMMDRPLFTPVDLQRYVNAGREVAPDRWQPALAQALADLPEGPQAFWGVPFELLVATPGAATPGAATPGADGASQGGACWILLGDGEGLTRTITVPLGRDGQDAGGPSYLVFLHLCGLPTAEPEGQPSPRPVPGPASLVRAGQPDRKSVV
jgi:hypothetical protein